MASDPARHADLVLQDAITLRPALRRFLARRVPPGEVDDLLQEIFLNLTKSRSEAEIENVSAYVFKVAANVVAGHFRGLGSRQPPMQADYRDDCDEVFASDRILISREDLQIVVAEIMALPERTRDVFMLHRFERLGYQEIARAFGISVSAVEKHIMKALHRLSKPDR